MSVHTEIQFYLSEHMVHLFMAEEALENSAYKLVQVRRCFQNLRTGN